MAKRKAPASVVGAPVPVMVRRFQVLAPVLSISRGEQVFFVSQGESKTIDLPIDQDWYMDLVTHGILKEIGGNT